MNKPAATEENSSSKIENSDKKKISFEGWLFYLLLFMIIIGLPAISAVWLLTAANSNYVP